MGSITCVVQNIIVPYLIHSSLYLLITYPYTLLLPPSLSPLVTTTFLSTSVSIFLFRKYIHYFLLLFQIPDICCCSVAKLCSTLCDPMDCVWYARLLCPPYLRSLLRIMSIEFVMQHHVSISSSAVPLSFCLQPLPASESFPVTQLFASCGQSIGTSALATVLLMNS